MPITPKTIPLDQFLSRLPVDAAGGVREAVDVMRRNEQAAMKLRGVEAELRPFFLSAGLSFVAGIVLLIFFSQPGGFLDKVVGAWPILTAVLGFLPALLAYYAIRIRRRSQADIHNFDLNKEYFLPHGAIYFPSDAELAQQMVTMVDVKAHQAGRRSKWDKLKPGTIW